MDELTGLEGSEWLQHSELSKQEKASSAMSAQDERSQLDEKILAQGLDLNDWMPEFESRKHAQPLIDASNKPKGLLEKFGLEPYARLTRKVVSKLSGQQSIEILQVWHLCQEGSEQFKWGWIDLPKSGEQFEGSLMQVGGWLVGKTVQPMTLQISADATLIAEVPVNVPRPDVIKAHFYDPKATSCGYGVTLDLEACSGELELLLEAVFANGETAPVGVIRLQKYG